MRRVRGWEIFDENIIQNQNLDLIKNIHKKPGDENNFGRESTKLKILALLKI